jgi:hypothetical protein
VSINRATLRDKARSIAQDAGPGNTATGIQLLLNDPGDYDLAVDQALAIFQQDRPNLRIVDYTVITSGFVFVLDGTGAILSSPNLWVDGFSVLQAVWYPFDATVMGDSPNDPNTYRIRQLPDAIRLKTVLEFLSQRPQAGQVIRLEFTAPHVLGDTPATTSVRAGDVQALATLAGSFILQLAANKLMQNTGNTGLPGDVVDRRNQSDVARSRAKELREFYNMLVGRAQVGDVQAASGFRDLDVEPSSGRGDFLWHPSYRR